MMNASTEAHAAEPATTGPVRSQPPPIVANVAVRLMRDSRVCRFLQLTPDAFPHVQLGMGRAMVAMQAFYQCKADYEVRRWRPVVDLLPAGTTRGRNDEVIRIKRRISVRL